MESVMDIYRSAAGEISGFYADDDLEKDIAWLMSLDASANGPGTLLRDFAGVLTIRPRANPERENGTYLGVQAKIVELEGWGTFPVDYDIVTRAVHELVTGSLQDCITDLALAEQPRGGTGETRVVLLCTSPRAAYAVASVFGWRPTAAWGDRETLLTVYLRTDGDRQRIEFPPSPNELDEALVRDLKGDKLPEAAATITALASVGKLFGNLEGGELPAAAGTNAVPAAVGSTAPHGTAQPVPDPFEAFLVQERRDAEDIVLWLREPDAEQPKESASQRLLSMLWATSAVLANHIFRWLHCLEARGGGRTSGVSKDLVAADLHKPLSYEEARANPPSLRVCQESVAVERWLAETVPLNGDPSPEQWSRCGALSPKAQQLAVQLLAALQARLRACSMADEEGLDLERNDIEDQLFAARYRALLDPFLLLHAEQHGFRAAESTLRQQVKAAKHHARMRGLLPPLGRPAGPATTPRLPVLGSRADRSEALEIRSVNQTYRLTAFADYLKKKTWNLWSQERGWPAAAEVIRAFRDEAAITVEKYADPCSHDFDVGHVDTYTLTGRELFNYVWRGRGTTRVEERRNYLRGWAVLREGKGLAPTGWWRCTTS